MNDFFKIPLLLLILFSSCNARNGSDDQHELISKQKEPEIEEKQFTLQERNIQTKDIDVKSPIPNKRKHKKELRFLFFANGGIVAYYNNGTYTGCPRCDFSKSNILAMFSADVAGTYVLQNDGSLLLNNGNVERPAIKSNNGAWALINFKWHIKPPQN